jgi:hypothetical protein
MVTNITNAIGLCVPTGGHPVNVDSLNENPNGDINHIFFILVSKLSEGRDKAFFGWFLHPLITE